MVIKVNENNTIVTASEGCMLYFKNDTTKSLFSECGVPGEINESDFVEVEIEIPEEIDLNNIIEKSINE